MADKKISEMPLLSQGSLVGSTDYVPIVDPSEVTVTDRNKRILANSLVMGAQFTQSGSGAQARTVESKLQDVVSVRDFGAVGDGVADDTAAIAAALATSSTAIYLPAGLYRITDSAQDGTPALTSTVAGRTIYGPGRITATTKVYKAIEITGARTRWHVSIDGNAKIAIGVYIAAIDCMVTHCVIRDLYSASGEYLCAGIWLDLDGLDGGAIIAHNVIRDVEAVGDATNGNGIGLSRGIAMNADSDITGVVLIVGNRIESIIGEEGDAIAYGSSNGAGTYYDLPCLIANNQITTWTRRAIKVQAGRATIRDNVLRNTYEANPGNMQHAVSLIQGGGHTIVGNDFINCRYAGQVVLSAGGVLERVDNIVIADNNIFDIGAETNAYSAIYVNSYGENVVVTGNKILCPAYAPAIAISVLNALSGRVGENYIRSAATAEYSFTGSVDVLTSLPTLRSNGPGIATQSDTGDALGVNVYGSTRRSLTLYNWDPTVSDAEVISRVEFHQNDADSNTVTASIRAVAVGSTGSTALTLHTGTVAAPDAERVRIGTTGTVTPAADNTQDLGAAATRWNEVYATILRPGAGTVQWTSGAGTPEGAVTAAIGSLYTRTDGGANTTLYVKETGTGNTGWAAK